MTTPLQINTNTVEALSDEEFISLVERFDALKSIEEKLTFIIYNSVSGEGIIIPVVREIEEKIYSYGFNVQRMVEAETIAGVLHQFLKTGMLDYYQKTFPTRLQLCTNKRERINLIEGEIEDKKGFLLEGVHKEYTQGYKFEKLKRTDLFDWCYVNLSGAMKYNSQFHRLIWETASGAALYKIEMYLVGLLANLKNNLTPRPKKANSPLVNKSTELSDFIEVEFLDFFLHTAVKIKGKIDAWTLGTKGSREECAGFCEAIFQKRWFLKVKPDNKTVNNPLVRAFAQYRFGINIDVQLQASKRKYREEHRDKFLKSPIW